MKSREFVMSMLRRDKVSALALMTDEASVEFQSKTPQTVLGVSDNDEWRAGCQLGAELPLKPDLQYGSDVDTAAPKFQAVSYKIICTNSANAVLVTMAGDEGKITYARGGYISSFSNTK